MTGHDGASVPRDLGEWAGGVTIATAGEVPVWACAVRWPGELPCGEAAQVSVVTGCASRAHVPAFLACVTCACEVQRGEECPVCGEDAAFSVFDLPGGTRS
jgi:hypothetical protein